MGSKLTYYDRQKIAFWHRFGLNAKQIAEKIKRDRTVVWRELKRNAGCYLPYDADKAEYFSKRRAKKTNRPKLEKDTKLREYVVERLVEGWSPEQIAGRLKRRPPKKLSGKKISHEAIYQYIYSEEPYLYHKLRRSHPNRQPRFSRKKRPVLILDKVSIEERPESISERKEVGHFESDSMLGRGHKLGISVQYERTIQLAMLAKLDSLSAETTKEALKETVESLPDSFVKSITFDNGRENAGHREIKDNYDIMTFFCDPYKAWQKGGVENLIGLIRQYIPKGTDLNQLTDEQLLNIQESINNRPRKSLDFRTPNELLKEYKRLEMLH